MKIQKIDFRFELTKTSQRKQIQQWLKYKHVREILCALNFKTVLSHLDKFFQGKSQYTYWVGYYKNDPFAFVIGSLEKNRSMSVDFIVCDPNYLEKGLLIPLIRAFRWCFTATFLVARVDSLQEVRRSLSNSPSKIFIDLWPIFYRIHKRLPTN